MANVFKRLKSRVQANAARIRASGEPRKTKLGMMPMDPSGIGGAKAAAGAVTRIAANIRQARMLMRGRVAAPVASRNAIAREAARMLETQKAYRPTTASVDLAKKDPVGFEMFKASRLRNAVEAAKRKKLGDPKTLAARRASWDKLTGAQKALARRAGGGRPRK